MYCEKSGGQPITYCITVVHASHVMFKTDFGKISKSEPVVFWSTCSCSVLSIIKIKNKNIGFTNPMGEEAMGAMTNWTDIA